MATITLLRDMTNEEVLAELNTMQLLADEDELYAMRDLAWIETLRREVKRRHLIN